jgi:hypothetical protein
MGILKKNRLAKERAMIVSPNPAQFPSSQKSPENVPMRLPARHTEGPHIHLHIGPGQ